VQTGLGGIINYPLKRWKINVKEQMVITAITCVIGQGSRFIYIPLENKHTRRDCVVSQTVHPHKIGTASAPGHSVSDIKCREKICFDFEAMRAVDIRTIDPATVVDIRDIKIKTELPQREKVIDFIQQAGNAYILKYGKMIIQSSFGDTKDTIEDLIEKSALSSFAGKR
jgi:hypothetical protein